MASEKKPELGSVLVIGGCGFLGHHVVRVLLRDYICSVSVIDLRCTRNRRPESDGVQYFEADITDGARLEEIFNQVKPQVVVHTASPPAQSNDSVSHALFKKVNVDGTAAIIKACQQTGVTALVYTSSASVMSDNKSDLINADERWPVIRGAQQSEYYSETKVRFTELCRFFNPPQANLASLFLLRPPPKSWFSKPTAPPPLPSSSPAPSVPRVSWAKATP